MATCARSSLSTLSQLKEKQKVKFIYGVLEKQFHNAYLKAEAMPRQDR